MMRVLRAPIWVALPASPANQTILLGSNHLSEVQGYILIPDNDLDLVQLELPQHIELTRQEPGCLVFRVERDEENKNLFNVYERFINQQTFELHQKQVKNSRWGAVTQNAERHYSIQFS